MNKLYLCVIIFLFINNSFPQVPILFYDFESNANRTVFEKEVEQSINSGSGLIVRVGSGTISNGAGETGRGKALYGSSWQSVSADPGINAKEYYQFSVNTTGFKGISVIFRNLAPYSYSPGSLGCNFSINGINYKSTGSNTTGAPSSNWNDANITLYNFPEVNNNPNLIIRIYAFKGISTDSYGVLKIDNLVVTADTIISGAGEISLLNENDFYNSYYSGGVGSMSYLWKKSLVMNGPGTVVTLASPVNFIQKVVVNNGCTLKCGLFPVWGSTSFTLEKGGAIYIGDPAGIISGADSAGNICVKGTRQYSPEADYYYNGTAAQVTGNGLPSAVNLLGINNSAGVNLTSNILVLDTLKLLTGNLILGNNDLIINDTAVAAGGTSGSYVVTDNSGGMVYNKMAQNMDVKFPVGTSTSYNPAIINYSGVSDTFKVRVKGTIDFEITNPNKVVNRQWTITENTPGGSNASVKLGWIMGQEAPGFNLNSNIMMGRWNGTLWDLTHATISGSGTPEDPYFASGTGITGFSYFGIGNEDALPVELTYFGFDQNGRQINLKWETATEKNSNNFEIERKEKNKNAWMKIGSVKANFLSNSTKYYSFVEQNMIPGDYFYRLKMNDNDGSYQYSNVIEVGIKKPVQYELLQNYPNPFNPSTFINYKLPADAHVLIEIFDIKGGLVCQVVNEFRKAGVYDIEFNPANARVNLSSGVYFYRMSTIEAGNGKIINIIKKMMYVK